MLKFSNEVYWIGVKYKGVTLNYSYHVGNADGSIKSKNDAIKKSYEYNEKRPDEIERFVSEIQYL